MSTIQPPPVRDLGARVPLTWEVGRYGEAPEIAAYDTADFGSVVGGEVFTLRVDGGAPTDVTLLAGDVTPAAIVARIDAALGVGTAFVAGDSFYVTGATSIEVVSYDVEADFDKIGLPILLRDSGAGVATTRKPGSFGATISEVVGGQSQVVDVPAGSNRVSVEVLVTPNDDRVGILLFVLGWSDGVNNEPPVDGTIGTPLIDPYAGSYALAPTFEVGQVIPGLVVVYVGDQLPFPVALAVPYEVPAGKTRVRLDLLGVLRPVGGTGAGVLNPPTVSAALCFGAR